MAKSLQILPKAEAGKTLSKAQKEFNSLDKKINSLRLEVEQVKELKMNFTEYIREYSDPRSYWGF